MSTHLLRNSISLHKKRLYLLTQKRSNYEACNRCQDRMCAELNQEQGECLCDQRKDASWKKRPLWAKFLGLAPKKRKPPKKMCRLLAAATCEFEDTPEFVEKMRHDPDRKIEKKGDGYIISIRHGMHSTQPKTKEDRILMKIEYPRGQFLEDECNPMPPFSTVGQRWIDLQQRGLHPLYKKFELPRGPRRKPYDASAYVCKSQKEYKFTSGDYDFDELPKKLKYTGMAKKVVFSEYKIPELPRQMVNRLREMEINMKSPLEYREFPERLCKVEKAGRMATEDGWNKLVPPEPLKELTNPNVQQTPHQIQNA